MLDLSNKPELEYLANLATAVRAAAGDLDYFLAGATARDLLLDHAYDINALRNTNDIALILRNYVDAGNRQRLYTEAAELLEAPDFDYEHAGAWLLGHDIATLLPDSSRPRVRELLNTESDVNSKLSLLGDLHIQPERALKLLQHLAKGFQLETGR